MSEPKAKLEISIKQILAPMLRADGFSGSGRSFRRQEGDFVFVLNIQGNRWGGSFAINMGIQPLAIVDVLGCAPDTRKISEPNCELRRRLSVKGADQWWQYDASQSSMDMAVKDAKEVYELHGRKFPEFLRKLYASSCGDG